MCVCVCVCVTSVSLAELHDGGSFGHFKKDANGYIYLTPESTPGNSKCGALNA